MRGDGSHVHAAAILLRPVRSLTQSSSRWSGSYAKRTAWTAGQPRRCTTRAMTRCADRGLRCTPAQHSAVLCWTVQDRACTIFLDGCRLFACMHRGMRCPPRQEVALTDPEESLASPSDAASPATQQHALADVQMQQQQRSNSNGSSQAASPVAAAGPGSSAQQPTGWCVEGACAQS
jgi:hypothetical protein